MMSSLVITLIGPDRPGLVSAISDKAAEHGANWADSLMGDFAGQFAGIVLLKVPAGKCDALMTSLRLLESPYLSIAIAKGDSARQAPAARRLQLDLVGHDRPGIIHAISGQLAERGVSIEKLQTRIASGAMSGEQMFHMNAQLKVPMALDPSELRAGLEGLANELMVDITVEGSVDGS